MYYNSILHRVGSDRMKDVFMIGKKGLILLSLLVLLIIFISLFIIPKDKSIKIITDKNVIENNENYNIKISYPILNDKTIDDKIKKLVDETINDFKEEVKELDSSKSYDLNIEYESSDNNLNLYSIHLIIYKYLGGAHYNREDLVYYYNYKINKELFWNDILIDDNKTLDRLAAISKEKLMLEYKDYLYSDESLNNGVKPIKDNFKIILFNNDNIKVVFPPFQVGPWSSGNLKINVKYKDLNDWITKNYQKTVEDTTANNDISSRSVRNVFDFQNEKLIALTFDDGPARKTTTKLLNGLKERDAKVTFFVLGSRVNPMKDLILRAYKEGHTIGNHTYNHKNLTNLNDKEVISEINDTNYEIEKIIGVKPKYIRPPYGSYNERIINLSDGMTFVLWIVDTLDWQSRSVNAVYNKIIESAKEGKILLMHDLYETTVDAVLRAIDDLSKEGYKFVSLEELERMEFITLSKGYISSFKRNH